MKKITVTYTVAYTHQAIQVHDGADPQEVWFAVDRSFETQAHQPNAATFTIEGDETVYVQKVADNVKEVLAILTEADVHHSVRKVITELLTKEI